MKADDLDRKARIAQRERQLRTELVNLGARRNTVELLRLEALFEMRWRLLNQLMAAPTGR